MTIKYLYLDDEESSKVMPFAQAVTARHSDECEIEIHHPSDFANLDLLAKELARFNGIILDWRLDQIKNDQTTNKFDLRAASVAQEIRTRETEGSIKPMPIILWSTQDRLANSYTGDKTSHDLFDVQFEKSYISENGAAVRGQLISLVNGFASLKKSSRKPEAALGAKSGSLDIRVVEHLKKDNLPVHEYARFILRELIQRPGLLVDEKLLASRLGIDIKKSKDWQALLSLFQPYKYLGPFNEAWPRWWAIGIEREWWITSKKQRSLSLLQADERIAALKKVTSLNSLFAAAPIMSDYHTCFYTICEHYQLPLDPLDGVIISEKEPAPWQNRRYLSLDAALNNLSDRFSPHPLERERLKEMKKLGQSKR